MTGSAPSPHARSEEVVTNVSPGLRRHWHPTGAVPEPGDPPRRVMVCGEPVVLVHLSDGPAALPDRCPHRHARLSEGEVVGGHLECPYHGWRFDGTGTCRLVPALGEGAPLPPRADLPAHHLREAYDLAWVALEDPLGELLDVPEWQAPGIVAAWLPETRVRAGAAQLLDNFLDFAHFPWVHAGTFGAAEDARIGDYEVERDGDGFVVRYEHVVENHEDPGVARGERPLLQPRVMEYSFRLPFAGRLRLELPLTGVENTIAFWARPEDADHSVVHCVLLRNDLDDPHGPAAARAVAYEASVLAEDVRLLELLPDTGLPVALPAQAHTRADRNTVEMRRLLSTLLTPAPPGGTP